MATVTIERMAGADSEPTSLKLEAVRANERPPGSNEDAASLFERRARAIQEAARFDARATGRNEGATTRLELATRERERPQRSAQIAPGTAERPAR